MHEMKCEHYQKAVAVVIITTMTTGLHDNLTKLQYETKFPPNFKRSVRSINKTHKCDEVQSVIQQVSACQVITHFFVHIPVSSQSIFPSSYNSVLEIEKGSNAGAFSNKFCSIKSVEYFQTTKCAK
jgi:hypothetical protein